MQTVVTGLHSINTDCRKQRGQSRLRALITCHLACRRGAETEAAHQKRLFECSVRCSAFPNNTTHLRASNPTQSICLLP